MSLEIARLDWHCLFAILGKREVNMSLYYVMLHFWIALGVTEASIRMLSVIFGVLAIPATYLLGVPFSGSGAG